MFGWLRQYLLEYSKYFILIIAKFYYYHHITLIFAMCEILYSLYKTIKMPKYNKYALRQSIGG